MLKFFFISLFFYCTQIFAHGFNADRVIIDKLPNGYYRIIIKYTNIEIGEYREAHADFKKYEEAQKLFNMLIKGADFFLGDITKSVHFHNPPEKNNPY